ncbi:MAG: competence/damage-inducible protein A [Candidatus Melainabacteria bacterium]|nr:competence/damage-inducible protein A [Candidatus Melainabacteria bacterium]
MVISKPKQSIAEVITVGTELLLGQIVDTNTQHLAQEMARLGINCFYHTTVGDNPERIIACIKAALKRADLIILSGGLGPTADDLTVECMAKALEVELDMHQPSLEHIKKFFSTRNITMPETNAKQALIPRGAEPLQNDTGTAPGIYWDVQPGLLSKLDIDSSRIMVALPGVPFELKHLFKTQVTPRLMQNGEAGSATIYSIDLRHYGIGESALAERYADLLHLSNPTVAPYAGHGECRLRVTAKAASLEEAKTLTKPVVDQIIERSGPLLYGFDDTNLETECARLLTQKGMTISLAESCTGGLMSKLLTDIAGSSKFISLNLVTYANEAKEKMVGVPAEILAKHGAVSEECAKSMARGVRLLTSSVIGYAITGIAGPDGGTADKPVGLVWLALDTENETITKELRLPSHLSRKEIRTRTAKEALNMLRLYLV